MGHRGIDGDHHIQGGNGGGGVGKVVQMGRSVEERRIAMAQHRQFFRPRILLQTDHRQTGKIQKARELVGRHGAHPIVFMFGPPAPDDADFQTRQFFEAFAPFRHFAALGLQIAHRSGNIGQVGFQQQRQAEHGVLKMITPGILGARHDRDSLADGGAQGLDFLGNMNHRLAPQRLDIQRIADELDIVAQSLLVMHDDGFAFQRLHPVPFRTGIMLAHRMGAFPPPAIGLPAHIEAPLHQIGQRAVPMGIDEIGQRRQSAVVILIGLVQLTDRNQTDRQIAVGLGIVGIVFQRL